MAEALIEYKVKLSALTKNQTKILNLLLEAGRLIAPIYKKQENDKYPGANFYPYDASKEEIEKAAKKDPQLLSPHTIVERQDGQLVAVPYHLKYASLLKPVSDKLFQAAKLSEDKNFSKLLELQAQALLDGSYDQVLINWIGSKMSPFSVLIGPFKRYDDKLFNTKTSYQAWVGIVDLDATKRANEFAAAILSARRKAILPAEKVDFYDKVQVRISDAILFAGFMAKIKFVGTFIPSNHKLLEQCGAKISLFKQPNDDRTDQEVIPAFNKFFSKGLTSSFSHDELNRGNMTYVFLHELAHTYLMYRNAESRLKDLYPIISELSATVYGMKVGGSLLLKDMINTKELESIMISFICRSLYHINKTAKSAFGPHLPNYVIGGTIFINYLIETEAIKSSGGITIPNFMKIFVSINELAERLEKLLISGSHEDAEIFIKKYSSTPKILVRG